MVGRRWLATLAAVACLVAAGCSDDDSEPPGAAPSTSSAGASPSASATEGPVEPEMPAAATKPTKAGAIAFVRHYWAVVDHAEATGDVAELRRMSGPGCEPCKQGTRSLEEMNSKGGRVVAKPRRVTAARASLTKFEGHDGVASYVEFTVVSPRQVVLYNEGKKERREGGVSKYLFLVSWLPQESRWVVSQWQLP